MDEDLFFALSGLANPRVSSLKSMEESCRSLCLGCNESAQWRQVLTSDAKQRDMVLQATVFMLEQHDRCTRRGLVAALAMLKVLSTAVVASATQATQEGILKNDPIMAKRLACAVTRQLVPSQQGQDALLGKGQDCTSLGAQVLILFTSSSSSALTAGADCALVMREEIASNPNLNKLVVDYCRTNLVITNETDDQQQTILALHLLEALCFMCTASCIVFARDLSPLLVQCTNSFAEIPRDIIVTAIRTMINLSNNCPEAGLSLVTCGAVRSLVDNLATFLHAESSEGPMKDLAELDAKDFDASLMCLTVLANLVEHPETQAVAQVRQDYVQFLCCVYASSLPVGARQQLLDGNSSETVSFSWDPEALVISSHVCLVLGCLVRDSKANADAVLRFVPGGKARGFSPLIQVLKMFLDFQADAEVLTPESDAVIRQVAGYFSQANARSMLPPSGLMSASAGAVPGAAGSSRDTKKQRNVPTSSTSSSSSSVRRG